jgi:hypothetical protein
MIVAIRPVGISVRRAATRQHVAVVADHAHRGLLEKRPYLTLASEIRRDVAIANPHQLPLRSCALALVAWMAGAHTSRSSDSASSRSSRRKPRQPGPFHPATATGPGGGSRLLRRCRGPDECGQIRACVGCGSLHRYGGARAESVDPRRRNRRGVSKGSGLTGLGATGWRRSVACCRSRVTPGFLLNCMPRSRSKLVHRPAQMAARQRLCSIDSVEVSLHGSEIAGDEYRGRGDRWPNANRLPAGVI